MRGFRAWVHLYGMTGEETLRGADYASSTSPKLY